MDELVLQREGVEAGAVALVADGGDELKRRQASWFDEEVDDELEITRPHGTPALYEWQYLEKFRRSVRGLATALSGSTALTVCGGSGMDAEFLARRGAAVISSDISLGAARRARERASRYGLSITPIVADVERLPFADGAIDLVYVHDGLHHLAHPFDGLGEMARVARLAISVNEPARAAVTALAVRLGLALEFEEAGNRVERLREREIADALEAAGFDIVVAQRYAMYFRHEPGRVTRRPAGPAGSTRPRAARSSSRGSIGTGSAPSRSSRGSRGSTAGGASACLRWASVPRRTSSASRAAVPS